MNGTTKRMGTAVAYSHMTQVRAAKVLINKRTGRPGVTRARVLQLVQSGELEVTQICEDVRLIPVEAVEKYNLRVQGAIKCNAARDPDDSMVVLGFRTTPEP